MSPYCNFISPRFLVVLLLVVFQMKEVPLLATTSPTLFVVAPFFPPLENAPTMRTLSSFTCGYMTHHAGHSARNHAYI